MKFDPSPEGQAFAHTVMSAIRDGEMERREGKPLHIGRDGKPVYRILLCGLPWRRVSQGVYEATDGDHVWRVESGRAGWSAQLVGDRSWPVLKTMRAARTACEERARRMP